MSSISYFSHFADLSISFTAQEKFSSRERESFCCIKEVDSLVSFINLKSQIGDIRHCMYMYV